MTVIGPAEIQLFPDATLFNRTIGRQIEPGLRQVEQGFARAVDNAERELTSLGPALERSIDDAEVGAGLTDEIRDELGRLREDAGDTGRELADALDGTGSGGRAVGAGLVDAIDQAGRLVEQELADMRREVEQDLAQIGDGVDIGEQLRRSAAAAAEDLVGEFDDVGPRIVDEFNQDLRGLGRGVTVPVDLDLDENQIRSELGNLDTTIDVDVPTGDIAAAVRLAGDLDANRQIRVGVDDGDINAAARLADGLEETRTIDVDADVSKAEREIEGLFDGVDFGNLSGSLGDAVAGAFSRVGPGGAAAAAGGAALAGLLAKSFFDGVEREASTDRLTASLGLTGPDADRVIAAAENLFGDAYGDTFEDAAAAVADATALAIPDLERTTGVALSMQAAFDGAAGEYLQLADQLRQQGVTDSVNESLDFLTTSFQQLPSNLREPLAEAVREYGVFLTDLGFDTEETFGLLVDAASRGEFELDKVGDALKEFSIRATDDSKATQAAFLAIGRSAEEVDRLEEALLSGGPSARAALDNIVDGLLAIPDAQERANAAIALFGTPLEDLSTVQIDDFLMRLQDIPAGFENVAGSAAVLDEQINDNLQVALTTWRRQWAEAFTDLGQGLQEAFAEGDTQELERSMERLAELAAETFSRSVEAYVATGGFTSVAKGFASALTPDGELFGDDNDEVAKRFVDNLLGLVGQGVSAAEIERINVPVELDFTFADIAAEVNNRDIGVSAVPITFTLDEQLGQIDAAELFAQGQFEAGITDLEGYIAALQEYRRQRDEIFAPFENAEGLRFERLRTELDKVPAAASGAAEGVSEFGDAASRSEEQVKALETAIEGLFDFSGEAALAQAAELIDELGDSLNGIGPAAVDAAGNLDLSTQAGRDLFNELSNASNAVSDLFASDLQPEQIAAALDAIRGSLAATLGDLDFTDEQIESLLATFVDADGRTIELGMGLDSAAFDTTLEEALAAGQGADGLVFEPGLDVASEAFYVGLQQADADGAAFAENPFIAPLGADPAPFNEDIAAATAQGNTFDGLRFEPGLDANQAPFNERVRDAEAEGNRLQGLSFDPDITANTASFFQSLGGADAARRQFDQATATIDAFANTAAAENALNYTARRRTQVIDVSVGRLPTLRVNSRGLIQGNDGAIIDKSGFRRFEDGGILDGIVPATPGGVPGIVNGTPVLVAENQGDELLLNSRSSDDRVRGLIREFDGGRVDRMLRESYLTESIERIDRIPFRDGGIIPGSSSSPSTGDGLLERIANAVETTTGTTDGGTTVVNNFIEQVIVSSGDSFGDDLALTPQLVGR